MKKLIRYRISIAVKFPSTHQRKGNETDFVDKILANTACDNCLLESELCDVMCSYSDLDPKIHTIRGNYELWEKRFEKINRGEAVIELYQWSGKPYNSKQVVFASLGKDDGIGLQALKLHDVMITGALKNNDVSLTSRNGGLTLSKVAKNDGLSLDDFKAWFKGDDLSKPMAIIHFTDFRY